MEKRQAEYQKKLEAIARPLIYTEGNNTDYLKKSQEIFSEEFEYDIDSLGGKSDIRKFFKVFSTANFTRFKIVFIFDCDAKSDFEACKLMETEYLIPYIFPENTNNTLVETKSGIENMFDDTCFENEEKLFSVTETTRDGSVISRNRALRKNVFKKHVTQDELDLNIFYNFEDTQHFICNKLF